jgi:hypothetical protein
MSNPKKRDRISTEQVSPPNKMSKNNRDTSHPSNADIMEQINQLISSNADVIKKIDQLEKRFDKVEKLFGEVETLRRKVAMMEKPFESFRRFEIERKQKSVLIKGLDSYSTKKYETRIETYKRMNDLFDHLGLGLTVEDYQRLGPLKPGESGSTMVRLQFWSRDDKSQLFAKFKEFSGDETIKKLSLINDYPSFQLSEVKRLSNEAYKLRQADKRIKTRIVPRGLEVQLQTRDLSGTWTTVRNLGDNQEDMSEA